jgi:hypothetical protein
LTNKVQLAAAINAGASFVLQLLLLHKFSRDSQYLALLVDLNLTLPFAMMLGSAAGLVFSRRLNQSDSRYIVLLQGYFLLNVATVVLISLLLTIFADPFAYDAVDERPHSRLPALAIAISVSMGSALAPILSAKGLHAQSVALSLGPNLLAIICIELIGQRIGIYSYVSSWVFGSAVTQIYLYAQIISRKTTHKLRIKTLLNECKEVIIAAPAFFIFGIHQFLDGVLLSELAIAILPAVAFLQRALIGVWNIVASKEISVTIEEFSAGNPQDMDAAEERLKKRLAKILKIGLILFILSAAIATLTKSSIYKSISIPLPSHIEIIVAGLPFYMLGGSAMIGVSCFIRAFIIRGKLKVIYFACLGVAGLYSALLACGLSSSIIDVSISYALSWFIGLLLLLAYFKWNKISPVSPLVVEVDRREKQ